MKKTRREFSLLSGLGLGGALAARGSLASARGSHEPRTIRMREEAAFSCLEVSLSKGRGSEILATFGRAPAGSEAGDILLTRSDDGISWKHSPALPRFIWSLVISKRRTLLFGPMSGASLPALS